MDTMTEEIWTRENALKKSLNITQEKTAEIRDTGKQVTELESFRLFVIVGKYFCHRVILAHLGSRYFGGNFKIF